MEQADTNEIGAGGKMSFVVMAGAITFAFGVILTVLLGPIGLFFVVIGGLVVLASPVLWVLVWWENRSDD